HAFHILFRVIPGLTTVVYLNMLGARVILQSVDREIPSIARALKATPWNFISQHQVGITVPASILRGTSMDRAASVVHTEALKPYGVSLARRMASPSDSKVSTVMTGPKISSCAASVP